VAQPNFQWKREHTAILAAGVAAGATVATTGIYLLATSAKRKLHAMRSFAVNVNSVQGAATATSAPYGATTLNWLEGVPASSEIIAQKMGVPTSYAILTDESTAPPGQTPTDLVKPVVPLGPMSGASFATVYTDERALSAACQGGLLPGAVKMVIYDYEAWPHTPVDQQEDPQAYCEDAAYAAHQAGLLFATAPSPNIMQAIEGDTSLSYAKAVQDFLQAGQVAAAARYADIFFIQAQVAESTPESYGAMVQSYALAAREASPYVEPWAVLSVAPGGSTIPVQQLYEMMLSAANAVAGFWLLLPVTNVSPQVMAERANTLIGLLASL